VTSQIEHEHIGDLKRRSKPTGAPDIIGPKSPKIDLNRRQTRLLISVVKIGRKIDRKAAKSTVKSTSKIGAKTGQKPTSKSKKHRKTSKLQNARRPKKGSKMDLKNGTQKRAEKRAPNPPKSTKLKSAEKRAPDPPKIHQSEIGQKGRFMHFLKKLADV
jgi:hypothetical protein